MFGSCWSLIIMFFLSFRQRTLDTLKLLRWVRWPDIKTGTGNRDMDGWARWRLNTPETDSRITFASSRTKWRNKASFVLTPNVKVVPLIRVSGVCAIVTLTASAMVWWEQTWYRDPITLLVIVMGLWTRLFSATTRTFQAPTLTPEWGCMTWTREFIKIPDFLSVYDCSVTLASDIKGTDVIDANDLLYASSYQGSTRKAAIHCMFSQSLPNSPHRYWWLFRRQISFYVTCGWANSCRPWHRIILSLCNNL